jgi:preprotein translocase subunit SecE
LVLDVLGVYVDMKLNQSDAISGDSSRKRPKGKTLFSHVEELKEELKKVSWTTQEELKLSTKIVILSIFIFGFGIYFFDLVIKGVLDSVALFVHFIFG